MKHTAIIILALAATVAGAADAVEPSHTTTPPFTISLHATYTGSTIATWPTEMVGRSGKLNQTDTELWIEIREECSTVCPPDVIDCERCLPPPPRWVRWQAVPTGRGIMRVKTEGMSDDYFWYFMTRNLYTGELIPLPVVWLD